MMSKLKNAPATISISIGVILISFTLSGQSGKNQLDSVLYRKGLKLNINISKTFGHNDFQIGNLAPVFVVSSKRNNFHEIELNTLNVEKNESNLYDSQGNLIANIHSVFDIGIRYQFTRNLVKKGNLIPQLGISFLSKYTADVNQPQDGSNFFNRRTDAWMEHISLSPQLRYNFKNRFFVDFSVPLELFKIGLSYQKIENPAIPIRQQRNGGYVFNNYVSDNFFKTLQLRFGGGLMFW